MNKKLIRLTESDLHRIVKESVGRVLNEVTRHDDTTLYKPHGNNPGVNRMEDARVQRVLSQLNKAKRYLMLIPGPASMDVNSYLHRGQSQEYGWELRDEKNFGTDIENAIKYIESAQKKLGFSSYTKEHFFGNDEIEDKHWTNHKNSEDVLNIH